MIHPRSVLPPPPSTPMKESDTQASVTVNAFRIIGATLISEAELSALLTDLVGQRLTLAELERAAHRLASHYRIRRWFARVYIPEQEVRDGVVRIAIVEGRLGGVDVDVVKGQRSDTDFVRRLVMRRLSIGKALGADGLERGLLLANDLSGVAVTGVLEPGIAVGETRLRLKIQDKPLLTGYVALANNGIKSTGTTQYSGGLLLNSPSGRGDQLELRATLTQRTEMGRLHYAVPLGTDGLRLSAYASSMHYRLGRQFSSLHASGDARTLGIGLTYPWLRSQTANITVGTGFEDRRYADDSLGEPVRRRRVNTLTLRMDGDRIDSVGGGGITQGGITLTGGRLDLGGNAEDLRTDQASARIDGDYTKLSGYISRMQRLPGVFRLFTSLSAQFAGKNLDSSEKFALGGPFGVRAYPVNEAVGDEGWLLSVELYRELWPGWQVFGLLDSGRVRLHRNTWSGWQGGSGTPNRYSLTGAGGGIIWSKAGSFSLSLVVATPLDDNPGETADGRNNDGSRVDSTRVWLNAVKYF